MAAFKIALSFLPDLASDFALDLLFEKAVSRRRSSFPGA
jgi:hypothetical protein